MYIDASMNLNDYNDKLNIVFQNSQISARPDSNALLSEKPELLSSDNICM